VTLRLALLPLRHGENGWVTGLVAGRRYVNTLRGLGVVTDTRWFASESPYPRGRSRAVKPPPFRRRGPAGHHPRTMT